MSKRDEFSPQVIRTVALRAGYLCSSPDCRKPTSGPHSDPTKAIITGEAAHICAAAEGGPRYDANQMPEQRKAITNAIWLCAVCSKKVDTDWKAWPHERLQQMKADHERWIAAEAMIPSPPGITLSTRDRLRLHANLPEITEAVQAALREHELVIRNPNRVELSNLALVMILPETVHRDGHAEVPTGPRVSIRPIYPAMTGSVTGNARVTAGPDVPTQNFRLEIDRLPANSHFRIAFYTVVPEQTMPYRLCKFLDNFPDPEGVCPKTLVCRWKYRQLLRGGVCLWQLSKLLIIVRK